MLSLSSFITDTSDDFFILVIVINGCIILVFTSHVSSIFHFRLAVWFLIITSNVVICLLISLISQTNTMRVLWQRKTGDIEPLMLIAWRTNTKSPVDPGPSEMDVAETQIHNLCVNVTNKPRAYTVNISVKFLNTQ